MDQCQVGVGGKKSPKKQIKNGTVVPGLANHLTPFVVDVKSFSEPSSRYHSWDFMRAEVGDAPGSIFEAPAKDAPGRPPPEDKGARVRGPMTNHGCNAFACALDSAFGGGASRPRWPSLIRRVLRGRHGTSTSQGTSSPHSRPLRRAGFGHGGALRGDHLHGHRRPFPCPPQGGFVPG